MDRSTPVSHLQRNAEQDPSAAEMMENIVHDLDHEQEPQPTQEEIEYMQHQMMMQQQARQQQMMQQQRAAAPPPSSSQQNPLEHQSFFQKILSEAKEPLLVSVLVMLMSSGQLQSLMNKFLPIASNNPLIGMALRALIAGVLFYLLRRFIPV